MSAFVKLKKSKKDQPERRRHRDESESVTTILPQSQYRRNRTISSHRRVDQPTEGSSRMKTHDLVRKRRKVGGILLVVSLIAVLLAVLVLQFTARVVVDSSDKTLARTVDVSRYETMILEYLSVHPIERLRFILNEDGLSEFMQSEVPEVAYVRQSASDEIAKTRFSVAFRVPVAAWQIGDRRLYVDNAGVVFSDNYYNEPNLKIVDQSGVSPEQGNTVVSTRLLSFVGKLVSLSGQGSYTINEVILPIGTTRQIDIKLKDVRPTIRLSIDREVGEQVQDMIKALDYIKRHKLSASYVDVRVSGRAVYR